MLLWQLLLCCYATTNFAAVGPAVNRAWPPLYSLPFIYPTSLVPSSDAPWRLTLWDRISRTEIKRTPHPARMLHPVEGWTIIIVGWAKRWQTSRTDRHARSLSDFNRRTSVSVPYSSPMFDVQDVSRFYRCSISDVHIGRSLLKIPRSMENCGP